MLLLKKKSILEFMYKVIIVSISIYILITYSWAEDFQCKVSNKKFECKNLFMVSESFNTYEFLTKEKYLNQFLRNFKYMKEHDGWKRYSPKTIEDINELLTRGDKNEMRLLIKKAAGTTRFNIEYKVLLGKSIVKKMMYTSYEGIQSIKTHWTIYYKNILNRPVPSRIEISTIQSLGHEELAKATAHSREFKDRIFLTYK